MVWSKKRIITIVGFIILTGAAAGYMIWNEPHRDIKDANGIQKTAVELYKDLTADSADHKAGLLNKIVIVSGKVAQLQTNQKGEQIILMQTNVPGASVNCTMEQKIPGKIYTGDAITVKGICSGYIPGDAEMGLPGDVYLIRCYLQNEKQ